MNEDEKEDLDGDSFLPREPSAAFKKLKNQADKLMEKAFDFP